MVSIKYEGVSTSLSQNQETKLQRLGGQRAHWFWITVTVLLSIFVLLLLRFNFCNRQSNTCFWTFRNATENLSQQNVEINCKQLSASLGVKALDYFVTQRKGEKCFLKDVEKLLGISIQVNWILHPLSFTEKTHLHFWWHWLKYFCQIPPCYPAQVFVLFRIKFQIKIKQCVHVDNTVLHTLILKLHITCFCKNANFHFTNAHFLVVLCIETVLL